MSAAPNVNRRSLIAGLAVAAAVGATAAASPASASRAEWDRLMTLHEAARQRYAASDDEWASAHRAWLEHRPARPQVTGIDFVGMRDDELFEYADLDKLVRSFEAGEGKWWWGAATKRRFRENIAAIRDYRARDTAIRRASGLDATNERLERQCDEVCNLQRALMEMPAPDTAALLWKLEEAFGTDKATFPDSEDCTPATCRRFLTQTMSDMRRLLGGEA